MTKATIGFAMCGSFCTFSKAFTQMQRLVDSGYDVIPIMSQNAFSTSTRFGKAEETVKRAEEITGTLAKLSRGITDTAVTMAAKSHLRILRPVLLCVATNDALGASAQNIGRLLNTKNIYFVPLKQDDCIKKPNSLVADFDKLEDCVTLALQGKQHQPIFL